MMKIVLGDQDYRSDSVLRQYKTHFNLTKDYYSFDYKFVHFVAGYRDIRLNTNSYRMI
jgi:hypothetical protein